jgi:RiboL-PSP-HEPN
MGHFESTAAGTFATSSEEVAQLRDIHEQISGKERGRRHLEVLNKSAIVLLCAIWEAYCEDLADEALRHLLTHLRDPSALPESLRRRIAKELKEDKHELSPWRVAGDGWKGHLRTRLNTLRQTRNIEWNNPKAANVDKFFEDALGIVKISDAWHWWRVSAPMAKHRLDLIVTLRGDIAHRGRSLAYVEKFRVTRALNHVSNLVKVTDAKVTRELKSITGVEPWSAPDPAS